MIIVIIVIIVTIMIVVIVVIVVIVIIVITVIVMIIVVTVIVMIVVIIVMVLAELNRRHGTHRLIDVDPIGLCALDDIEEALFEGTAIHDEYIGGAHGGSLLRRGLEIVWVGADRHDRDDLDRPTRQLGNNVAEDVRRDDHGGNTPRCGRAIVVAARRGEHGKGQHGGQKLHDSGHRRLQK
jgi:hypothetical protein